MATANSSAAGGKPDGDKKHEATAPSVQAGTAWPRALRIDVELAENHAGRTGAAGGFGRIDGKSRPTTFPTRRRPSKQSSEPRRRQCSLAETCGGGDDDTRRPGEAGLRVGVGVAEGHARAEGSADLAAGEIGRLRVLLESRRHGSGIVTRSTGGRRSIASGNDTPKDVVLDGEDKNMAPGDGVPQTLGGHGGGRGANGDSKANDATCRRGSANRIMSMVERYWCDQEGAAMAGGGEAARSTGVDTSSESREGQGRIKRLRRGGVTEAGREKVNDDDSRTQLVLPRPPSRHHHHQLEPRIGINDEEIQHYQHQQRRLVGPTTMNDVAALMKQALATVAMASAVSAAAESTPITTTDVKTSFAPPPPSPPPAIAPTTAPPKNKTTSTAPPQPQGQKSKSTLREANAAYYIELRHFANEIDGRCAAATKTLHAASRAVARPGEELNQSYGAYCHSYRRLQAAERSVRDAEEQEAAAVDELRRAGEVVEAAEEEVARAAKNLRVCDADRGGRSSSHHPPTNDTAKKKKQENKSDGDDDDCGRSDREGSPPPALSDEANSSQNSTTHEHDKKSRRARESLMLALETAGSNADRALAEQHRAQEETIAAMTLVAARTAGEWSLAEEACKAAKKRFQRAGLEAIPKIKLFSEEARLFRNLNKLRGDARQRLNEAPQARKAESVAAAEAVAATVMKRMSAPVATAVAVKAAAEAAARVKAAAEPAARAADHSGGDGENASLPEPAVKQEEKEEEEEKDDEEEEDGNREEAGKETEEGEQGTRQWAISAAPWISGEEAGRKNEGGAEATRASAAMKRAKT